MIPALTDPTGLAAHAAGRGLNATGQGITAVSQVAALMDVCTPDTVTVLDRLKIPTAIVVVKRPQSSYWTIWQNADAGRIIEALTVSDEFPPDEYSDAWRDFSDDGAVKSLDALCSAWLEFWPERGEA